MTILDRPKLGTDPLRGWMYFDLHFASTYVFGEAILLGHYRSCIERAVDVKEVGLGDWARKMKAQDYHEIYSRAFISMWSAFETGIENMVATYLQNDVETARKTFSHLSKGRRAEHPLGTWPWTRDVCLMDARTLESKAIKATANGRVDLFGRLKTLLGWLDVHLEDEPEFTAALAEANRARDIILHRYGEVAESDVASVPSLRPWAGEVIPMNADRFWQYQRAIGEMVIAAMKAVRNSRHHPRERATKFLGRAQKSWGPVSASNVCMGRISQTSNPRNRRSAYENPRCIFHEFASTIGEIWVGRMPKSDRKAPGFDVFFVS